MSTTTDIQLAWKNLVAQYDERVASGADLDINDVSPILEIFGLNLRKHIALRLPLPASFKSPLLSNHFVCAPDDRLTQAGAAMYPGSQIGIMLQHSISSTSRGRHACNDLIQARDTLRRLENATGQQQECRSQQVYIRCLLLWLYNILSTETSSLRWCVTVELLITLSYIVEGGLPICLIIAINTAGEKGLLARVVTEDLFLSKIGEGNFILETEDSCDVPQTVFENRHQDGVTAEVLVEAPLNAGVKMTFVIDQPHHDEIVFAELALKDGEMDPEVICWIGEWDARFVSADGSFELRMVPEAVPGLVLRGVKKSPLGTWMWKHHQGMMVRALALLTTNED